MLGELPLLGGSAMKRIVILIDGTWDKEGTKADTNVAKLDPNNRSVSKALIKRNAADGTIQDVFYHDGVGVHGELVRRWFGALVGAGLKQIIQECYGVIAEKFESGDELYILGFSRGAYAARALAGMIGASGIQRQPAAEGFEIAWSHYRVKPAVRTGTQSPTSADRKAIGEYSSLSASNAFHQDRRIRCVGVWDTVGSYGIPAGFGFASLARYVPLLLLGFHDTSFGDHIDVGLHAVAIDERRREFVPTFWTIPKGKSPRGRVEQTWFSGVHENVGGGYPDSGLSDTALIWMIARMEALTGLEFDWQATRASTKPNIDGEVYDSTRGIWQISHHFPHVRAVLSPDAIHHGYMTNTPEPAEENINEKVHWSVLQKRERPCTFFGVPNTPYNPPNLPATIPAGVIALRTPEEEKALIE
jgi:uncharacterized protein (DUF2235 family)